MIFKFISPSYLLIYVTIIYSGLIQASVINVSKISGVQSIRFAIKKANSGDTIIVSAGTYFEKNILINKPLTLIGENYPVLDGQHTYELVSIKSDYVVLKGFKLQHSGNGTLDDLAGIKIYESKHVTIENNILDDTFFGIYVQFGKNCIIKNNQVTAYGTEEQQIGNGIHCWKSNSLQIIGIRIEGLRNGIYFELVTNSII